MFLDIKKILITSFSVHEEDIHDGVTLEDLGLDSLELVELSMQLEDLGATITDDELAKTQSLDAIARLAETRAAESR